MISSADSCRQLVAGNYDVILNEPTTLKTVLTEFLDRCELYENELLQHHLQQQQQQQQDPQSSALVAPNDQHHQSTSKDDEQQQGASTETTPSISYINEFKMLKELSRMLKKDTSSFVDGLEPYNRAKNRYGDIIPFNHTRVILSCNPKHRPYNQKPQTLYHNRNDEHQHNHQYPQHRVSSQQQQLYELGSDYINANYIRGPSGSPRAYIASQGPLPSTLNDFWRMIWECNVSVIVMACNELELGRSKCELYWPEQLETSQVYGNIQVTLMRVRQVNSDFLIRKFSVKYLEPEQQHDDICGDVNKNNVYNQIVNTSKATTASTITSSTLNACSSINFDASSTAESESSGVSDDSKATRTSSTNNSINHDRMAAGQSEATGCAVAGYAQRKVLMEKSVVQFHISSWPDHGVPDSVQPILELVRLIREVQPFEDTPILVHCSAGCGRTGTICCIDYVYGLMRMGKLDASFNLFSIISEMRKQRMAMVQTLEQYILCHRAVASLFMQQLQLFGQFNQRHSGHNQEHGERRADCDAKLTLASARTSGEQPAESDQLDTSNETSENSYKLYQHETSSSTDEQQTSSDYQEEDDEEDDQDLGPVFI